MDCQKQELEGAIEVVKVTFGMVRATAPHVNYSVDDLQGTLCPGRPDRPVSDDPIDEQSNP
jgi:hypothetical protein